MFTAPVPPGYGVEVLGPPARRCQQLPCFSEKNDGDRTSFPLFAGHEKIGRCHCKANCKANARRCTYFCVGRGFISIVVIIINTFRALVLFLRYRVPIFTAINNILLF